MTRRNVWRHIDPSDFVATGLMTAGVTLLFGCVITLISLFVGPPKDSWWSVLIASGIIGFVVAFGGTLIILGHAIYDWYEYDYDYGRNNDHT